MRRLALLIEYDGTAFSGWQVQENAKSIQGELEAAFHVLFGEQLRVSGAGRTDSGVHATGMVAHVDLEHSIDPSRLARALNTKLPSAIQAITAKEVPRTFNARRDAVLRRYRYFLADGHLPDVLCRRWIERIPERLDCSAMNEAASAWIGHHDFSSFRATGCQADSPMRTMDRIEIIRTLPSLAARSECIVFTFESEAYLRSQVRVMVGTLVEIGLGKQQPEWASEVLHARRRDAAAATFSAKGLVLDEVRYDPAIF